MIGELLDHLAESLVSYPAIAVVLLLFAVAFPFVVLADLTAGEYRPRPIRLFS